MSFCRRRLRNIQSSMDENMCQQTSLPKSQVRHFKEQSTPRAMNCHRCNMCSSYSSSPSLSSISVGSSSSSSSLSNVSVPVMSPSSENHHSRRSRDKKSSSSCFIQQHLQSMFNLLRREETLKMAVRLESGYPNRTRYLVVVSRIGRNVSEECCLLGIDCNQSTTVGLVLRVLADTSITLDGDGGFSVSANGRQHIFKPVSVQAMWSALQTLYKISNKARECNYFERGTTHEWVNYYEKNIQSDQSCLNEWHTMNDIESRRPPSPDSLRSKPRERLETEHIIRSTLKEIMMSVDLDEVTSKYIRSRLEEQLDVDLREYKSFIDQEMLVILGQMDEATEVFSHVYLGSEWNASNLEELNKNGICHILNVTREIDNFFPGTFDYMNVRVYDDDNTDLLKHWDNTYKYIDKVKNKDSKVLVHCKMGISRSASVVIAYAMKAYGWDFKKAFEHIQKKRTCIKPNQNFINQLETYQGMLDAMKNREKLLRSKSETNLKSSLSQPQFRAYNKKKRERDEHKRHTSTQPNNKSAKNLIVETDDTMLRACSGVELSQLSLRPKSWSPDTLVASEILNGAVSQSLERLNVCKSTDVSHSSSVSSLGTSPPHIPPAPPLPPANSRYNLNVGMLCENGFTYSVSQNKIVQLYSAQNQSTVLKESNNYPMHLSARSSESSSYALQLPSQFQSNAITLAKQEKINNLVIKSISNVIVNGVASMPGTSLGAKMGPNSGASIPKLTGRTPKKKPPCEWSSGDSSSVSNIPRYQNNKWNTPSTDEQRSRTPFEVIESAQRNEYNSANKVNNNDPTIKMMTSHSTNTLSVVTVTTTSTNMTTTSSVLQPEPTKRARTMWPAVGSCHERTSSSTQLREDDTKDGKVSALTKKFEAKCSVQEKVKDRNQKTTEDNNNNEDARSLPCSPINEPTSSKRGSNNSSGESSSSSEVRRLVGEYDEKSKVRPKIERKQPPVPPRMSSFNAISKPLPSNHRNQYIRAPILGRTSVNNTSPVFNTM